MPSYDKTYLLDAMENMGEMAYSAASCFGLNLDVFWQSFLASGYAEAFGAGAPCVVAGLSGAELALRVCEETGLVVPCSRGRYAELVRSSDLSLELTCEYWSGWALAYYQWASERSFKSIWAAVRMENIGRMYPTFHEESELRFCDAMEELISGAAQKSTRLQTQRKLVGLSQSQLAKKSGVGLRAVQQYEQRAKDINKASYASVAAIARALYCTPGDILEPASRFEYTVVDF